MSTATDLLLLLTPKVTAASRPAIPTSTNLKEWLRADTDTYQDNGLTTLASADGDAVGGWKDQSGAGKNATQGTTAAKPTLKLAANGIGSRAALSFDGGDWLATAAFAAALAQPNTIYVVFKFATATEAASRTLVDGAAAHQHLLRKENSNPGKYQIYAGGSVLAEAASSTTTTPHVAAALFNGASSQVWIDNASRITGNPGPNDLSMLNIGSDNANANGLTGLIAEVLIYNAAHDAATRQSIQAWLATWYGITLS